jgi:hypothetical protein
MTTESVLDIRGHTVRRDGEIVATLTYSNGYTNVRTPEGTVIGRAFQVSKDPERYFAWDAKHPATYTPSDEQLTGDVTYETAIAAILWRHAQEQPRYTDIRFTESDWTPGDTALVTSNGHGTTSSEWRLADLRVLRDRVDARIEDLTRRA